MWKVVIQFDVYENIYGGCNISLIIVTKRSDADISVAAQLKKSFASNNGI